MSDNRYIIVTNHQSGRAPSYLYDFEIELDDITITTTTIGRVAKRFNHIKEAQKFIDLLIGYKADKGYNLFIDSTET